MRRKLLFFLMIVSSGLLFAQTDTIRSLVISEVRYDRADHAYLELTNMSDQTINLGEFEIVSHDPWTTFPDGALWPTEPQRPNDRRWTMLPAVDLAPGESYVIASFHDWVEEQYAKDVARLGFSPDHQPHLTKPELKELTDLPIHRAESPNNDPTDSISVFSELLESWSYSAIFLRHHPPGGDSCTVDQVGGLFTDPDGSNPNGGYHDVAGFTGASGRAVLVRRFDVKEGNLTFVTGNDLSESEWIPIPVLRENDDTYEPWRAVFWTVGNHGDYNLDEQTLTSSVIDIDWANHVLTVPYGVRNDDSIMYAFNRVPGLAWHYHYNTGENASADSAYASVRTGDSLTIYACGNDLDVIKWHIEAAPPTADANWVIPMRKRSEWDGNYPENGEVWKVTHMMREGVLDTIFEIPYNTRKDSLLKYLEKPPLASWEFIWVDGNERTDLKEGDLLRVTAEDGSVKDYYLKLQKYRASRNAYLSAITWPDIPEDYKGIYGWVGDTIPEFNRGKFDYKVTVPWDVSGIPSLFAKNENDNASHVVDRASTLFGSLEDKTVTITSTAEDDTTILEYKIILEKQKNLDDIQPWAGEPFISQFTWKSEWSHTLVEIVNPGTEVLDLSNYMFFCGYENNPASAIAGWGEWNDRYIKYIPGYKWQDEADWTVQRSVAVQDVNVNPNVYPGDVFVMAEVNESDEDYQTYEFKDQIDIDFRHNPWGEDYEGATAVYSWKGMNFYMWRIDNDSIKQGLKPATDPNDFTLIEVFGMGDGSDFAPIGEPSGQTSSYTRKPHIYTGNDQFGFDGSFGQTPEESEWILTNHHTLQLKGYPWPEWNTLVPEGTGSHFMDEVTIYRSTVNSVVYKVSPGYSMEEEIRGVVDSTSVEDMLGNLIPADTGQRMKVIAVADGAVLELTDLVMNGDTLVVTSADSSNVSKYILEVGAGLSDDAVLTSSTYTVAVDGATGTVSGMEYGAVLKDVVNELNVPAGATLTVVDENDGYLPFVRLNFDTVYVDVTVRGSEYLDVVAEDAVTSIKYQLVPNSDSSDAFVMSDVYLVEQEQFLISLVPEGISVEAFLSYLELPAGATMQLYDKLGYERNDGLVSMDDKLVVTSADGSVNVTYYLKVLNQQPNYLAYVISDVYKVNESDMTITGVPETHTVSDFKSNLSPAAGATIVVTDADGTVKADADAMTNGDLLQVTAGNGVTTVSYVVTLSTGIDNPAELAVSIYPNPSNGLLYIKGAETGSRISVYNAVGVQMRSIVAYNALETISLEGEASGMYFITISNDKAVLGQYKVIVK
ncbi:MAG: hypothetical protein CSA96_04355 [Bacteroidetes bacterium]|nr:MAG: hypothetical protein CSA96_04355 [Bacteroidota bacterium]